MFAGTLLAAAFTLDRLFPPDLRKYQQRSTEVVDREGRLLRAFTTGDGVWRHPLLPQQVDPLYLAMLKAYEDKRFDSHFGVDPLAVGRAAVQLLVHGRIVSGASTITMQVARLLEPRPRTIGAKLVEMARALQLERRFAKNEILAMYLTLAPFGGNLEGTRAAALAYLGKEPQALTPAEAALLVALPQSPTRLRPDHHAEAARSARDRVLRRSVSAGVLAPEELSSAQQSPVPDTRQAPRMLAPHLAERLRRTAPISADAIVTTIDARLQQQLEKLARRLIPRLETGATIAALVVHNPTRDVRAYVGAADYFDGSRRGMIDMVTAVRSPGSTLKPFIYGLAFDRLLVHPDTLVDDRKSNFAGYSPTNFDGGYRGEVTVRDALRRSLNTPAVEVLSRLGAPAFDGALREAGITLRFDRANGAAALPIALGGVGTTLHDLVTLYTAIATGGQAMPLRFRDGQSRTAPHRLLQPLGAWYIGTILEGTPRPAGHADGLQPIAYKTGTSYGFRDAWAIGFTPEYTAGVWVGRPDGTPCASCIGIEAAAPVLFQIFDILPQAPAALAAAPPGALLGPTRNLPASLQRFGQAARTRQAEKPSRSLRIGFPVDGSTINLARRGDGIDPLPLEAEGGVAPLRWLVNGEPLPAPPRHRRVSQRWQPDGAGFASIQVVDADGRSAIAEIFIQPVSSRP